MLLFLLILSLLSIFAISMSASRQMVKYYASFYFAAQCSLVVWGCLNIGSTELEFFTLDELGVSYLVMMAIMGGLTLWRSFRYLDIESLRHYKIYFSSLVALNIALVGVYLANNITVTWIFLEATTIATAGLTYHRRTVRSLEATWKYIFVCSVGIAVAYLGILMIATASHTSHGQADLAYSALQTAIASGNSLYLKLGFLFILVGYSSKMEIFPLFTVGVDANHAAPSPASAFISSAMVGGGFVAIFRVFRMISGNAAVYHWAQNVMIVVGILSLLVAAVYMGRTTNYKRLFAYSTVENTGLMALGLGIGGWGIFAAVLHSLAHTMIKGVAFLQLSIIGKIYHNYKIGRIGDYYAVDRMGAVVMTMVIVGLLAMTPSLLFWSEYLIFSELIASGGRTWLMIPIGLLLIAIIYWLCSKVIPILYKPCDHTKLNIKAADPILSSVLASIMAMIFTLSFWQPQLFVDFISRIAFFK